MHACRRLLALASLALTVAGTRDASAGWPPLPKADLASSANWPNDPGYPALWNYFSYLPTRASGAGAPAYSAPDQALGASGMSIDKAWESTIGNPLVRIAVVDSGILWDEPDLVQQVWLNPGELTGSQMPRTAAGLPCPGLGGYDCNGDGVFSVADYANDPRITPVVAGDPCVTPSTGKAGGDRILGDLNHNCILDAGDLILLFSDGVDDDANGYTDDIAGWDFFANDNNPYDDTRNGHGTTVALQANAQGNNGVESIGVCPLCRLLVLRAGSSEVLGSNDAAKALVYAADSAATVGTGEGAVVAALAVNALNLTGFGRAAIDYAYSRDVLVVASMGDDNSRHHEVLASYNHTLPVHAVAYDGATPADSTSFLDYVNCTSYGAQLALSASGTGCSDEAVARTAGVAALASSYAQTIKLTPPLSAEELLQLLKGTADTINVPASRDPATAASYYESLPGFSQRFGYGRINAARAMAALAAGEVPPEVDIESPLWFSPIYADRTSAPVPILGRVVASRATTYDVAVEWASGVEPLDSAFAPLGPPVTGVPGQTVTGGASPLALIDPTAIDTAHIEDPDSHDGGNDRTITVRIRVVAHYPSFDVTGEARRALMVENQRNGLDPDLMPGFPLAFAGSIESSPKLADIDSDGTPEIILAVNDGSLHVISVASGSPVEKNGFPYPLHPIDGLDPGAPVPSVPSYLTAPAYVAGANGGITVSVTRESVNGTPAIGNVVSALASAMPEIVFVSYEGTIYVVDYTGGDAPGWPQRLPLVPSCPEDPSVPPPPGDCMDSTHDIARGAYASPVLADLDGDGVLDIVVAAFDGNIYAFHGDGSAMAGFPVRVSSPKADRLTRIMSTPAVADYTMDGVPDILTGTNETLGAGGNTGLSFLVDGRGTAAPAGLLFPRWPLEVGSLYSSPVIGEGTMASPIAVSLGGQAPPDALLQGNGSAPLVVPANPGTQTGSDLPSLALPAPDGGERGFAGLTHFGAQSLATPGKMLPLFSHPAVGDLDQDGIPDVVMSGSSEALLENLAAKTAVPFQHLVAMWSGATGAMMPGSPFVIEDYTRMSNPAIADITGDGYPEVILGTGGYFVHAVDACGHEAAGWPKLTVGWTMGAPAVGALLMGSPALNVVAATREGNLFAWATKGTTAGVVAWESFHHDNANTGAAATQTPTAATPLVCVNLGPDGGGGGSGQQGSSGGCSCQASPEGAAIPWSLAGLTLWLLRRKRRRAE